MENFSPELLTKIKLLQEKYAQRGQDFGVYLDGFYHSDYITYWDYINLDALLNLQHPRTSIPDEKTFIIYHQITELYFRLIRNSIELICDDKNLTAENFIKQLKRICNYFEHLAHSFNIMIEGMDRNQFLKFRLALTPASGFQSAQYRMIEISATDLVNLTKIEARKDLSGSESISELLEKLYWRQGATELETGKKTLTLAMFEEKYMNEFLILAENYRSKNIWQKYKSMSSGEKQNPVLIKELRRYDYTSNVFWPLQHYRSAAAYMEKKPEDIPSTGGTNWQKYLPPRFQKIIYFPELWSDEEKENWGKPQ